jgi:Integrase
MKEKLADKEIKTANATPEGKPTILTDGGGLYVYVTTKGKYWRYSYRYAGKRQTLSIGSYPETTLKQARELHRQARAQLERGIKPTNPKYIEEKGVQTFQSAAMEWFNYSKVKWSETHIERTEGCLRRDVFPWIGKTDVNAVTPRDVIKVVQRVESRGAGETARRVMQCMNQVYKYAVTLQLADRNPVADIDSNIILKPIVSKNFSAITDPAKIGQLLRDMDNYQGSLVVRCALQLSALVMLRPGELRAAEWQEIDLDAGLWIIPVRRMKARTHIKLANMTSHTVPLPHQAVTILREIQPLTGRFKYVFPSARGASRCMSENAVRAALRAMGYDNDTMTPHGFRGMASTMLNRARNNSGTRMWDIDLIEQQLAHVDGSVRGDYNRPDSPEAISQRREMLQYWANYLDELRTYGQVLPFKAKKH